jgi:N-acetyl-anhydromuramyl-L-alanine amidase AmpD
MATNEQGAIAAFNTNCFYNRNGYKPRYVILHGTAGGSSAENIATYFAGTVGTNNPVSANYVIGRDGVIVQCNREEDGAYANGVLTSGHDSFWDESVNPNLITISIEHLKPHDDNSDALTEPQRASSFALVKHICQRHSIPMRKADAMVVSPATIQWTR